MIVVTGANGFIGSNAALTLQQRGDAVVHVDDYPSLRGRGPSADPPAELRYEPCGRLYLDRDDLPAWLRNGGRDVRSITGIVHEGAVSDTTVTDRDLVMRLNFDYTRTLWSFCAEHAIPLVYASSAATYGDGAQGFDDRVDPSRYHPLNLYAESKQRFDLWALEQQRAGASGGSGGQPPRWAGVKYFNVYGPRETHKGRMASMAFHWYGQVRATGATRLFRSDKPGVPDGGQQRDFVYVADAVDATLYLLDTPSGDASDAAPNGLYNIGTGRARTFADLARAVSAALGQPPRLEFIPMPPDLRGKYQYFTQAEVSKLMAAGFPRPFVSLEEGVKQYVDWLERQPK